MRCIRSRSVLSLALLGLTLGASSAAADVRLPAIFGDHMVLQADLPPNLFGWADPGEEVRLSVRSGAGVAGGELLRSAATRADAQGRFRITLEPLPAGGPYSVVFQGTNEIVLRDVLVGEVWIASGQSNMEWPVSKSSGAQAELEREHPRSLRLFHIERTAADAPADDVRGAWVAVDAETLAGFSAVAYCFGRELSTRIARPVGLIEVAWGGTPAESWTERSFLEGSELFAPILERRPDYPQHDAATLYNGMIAPLSALRVRGAIWYQGESNAARAEQYGPLFQALIRSWRAAFDDPELAFLYVQLASHYAQVEEPGASEWAELREAQAQALQLPRTAMVTAIDVGDADDIHPRDKRTVGERLALAARGLVYGHDVQHSGPRFRSLALEGAELVVSFDHAAGLRTRDGAAPTGFAIASAEGEFRWATARIEDGRVRLSSPDVPEPRHVRYAWADNPKINLVSGAGLPALPFRTDARPLSTAGRR